MFTDYYEACEATISRAMARAEIERHDVEGGFDLFLLEVGDRDAYEGKEVLDWLGY